MNKFEVTRNGNLWTTHFDTHKEAEEFSISETLKMPMDIFEAREMRNDAVYANGKTIDDIKRKLCNEGNIMP